MFLKQTSDLLSLSPNPFPPERGYITGATAPDQARMLAVSRTKPLHDAVAQMADDLYGGFAPATPFSENTKVYRQTEIRTSKRGAYCFIFTFTLPLSSASVFLLHRSAAL